MSFFATDKDLRKVPSKKVTPRPTTNIRATVSKTHAPVTTLLPAATVVPLHHLHNQPTDGGANPTERSNPQLPMTKDDIITIARQERDLRNHVKKLNEYAVKLQSWYRSKRDSKLYYQRMIDSLNSQLQDISKVKSLLAVQQQPFVAPVTVAAKHLGKVLLIFKYAKKSPQFQKIFNAFCTLVLVPASETDDVSKNIVVAELNAKNGFRRLKILCSILLAGLVEKRSDTTTFLVYANTISVLLFDNGQRNNDILTAKMYWRTEVVGNRILSDVRRHILSLSSVVGSLSINDMDSFDEIRVKISESTVGIIGAASALFSVARKIVHCCGIDLLDLNIHLFIKDVLSIPFVTAMIDENCIVNFITEESVLKMIIDDFLQNKSASFSITTTSKRSVVLEELEQSVDEYGISRLQYAIANIISCFSSAVLVKIFEYHANSVKSNLTALLRFTVKFIDQIYFSDLSNDASKISWKVSGSRMLAIEKPRLFVLQFAVVLERSFLVMILDEAVDIPNITSSNINWHNWGIKKDEKDIVASLSTSSANLVNKRLHHNQSSWFGSSWADKLGLSSLGASSVSKNEKGIFSWFSSFGSKSPTSSGSSYSNLEFVRDKLMFSEIVRLLALILSPASNTKYTSKSWKAVSSLSFSRPVILLLWHQMHETYQGFEEICFHFNPDDTKRYCVLSDSFCMIASFLSCLKAYLIALDDIELYDQQKPLPLHQMLPLIRGCNTLLFKLLKYNAKLSSDGFTVDTVVSPALLAKDIIGSSSNTDKYLSTIILDVYSATIKNLHFILADLYARWARRPFTSIESWLISNGNVVSLNAHGPIRGNFSLAVLQWMPWSVDFSKRLKFVRDELDRERMSVQGGQDPYGFGGGFQTSGTVIRIRRGQVMVDGMRSLMTMSHDQWRDRIIVRYINELGMDEAGIDVGGLFKDFVTELSSTIFDPSYGLFSQTFDGFLYPNPAAGTIFQSTELDDMFLFIGRVLGKAMYENITVSPQFTHFFLAFMHGRYNFMNLIDDLATLDPDLFKNLMFLKNCEEQLVSDLSLTFSIVDGSFGINKEIDLIPGGANVNVTARNRNWYISSVAKYYLHDRICIQAGAFFRGLHELISPVLLKVFCPAEMQIMISGSISDINLGDWKSNTRYSGGYTSLDPYVQHFWSIVESMSEIEKGLLLRFVTSVPRPPSLGFSALNPPFTIQRVEVESDNRLPTSSTCFNILKLPKYSNKSVLKEKILLAIQSRSGFDLS